MKAAAVIGAGYGDEGKGLITDYITSKSAKPLVVRFNGGAQAGHTVVTPDNKQHVFHHFGSGSFLGAPTFLSDHIIVNPILYCAEELELLKLNVHPSVYVDPFCRVTTPWDMMINVALERSRGDGRHGSCGGGIYETVLRNAEGPRLYFGDLSLDVEHRHLREKLKTIRHDYCYVRAQALGLAPIERFFDNAIMDRFIGECEHMVNNTLLHAWNKDVASIYDTLIFEGAQGLMLDMSHKNFPHVTPSRTGMHNVHVLCHQIGIEEIDAYYVSRTYATRHGAGPLAFEQTGRPYTNANCLTNEPNEHQGTLRYGLLDYIGIVDEIRHDLAVTTRHRVNPYFALTHADQINSHVSYMVSAIACDDSPDGFASGICGDIKGKGYLISHGRTRNDIERSTYGGYAGAHSEADGRDQLAGV